jgi:hypothetical protein
LHTSLSTKCFSPFVFYLHTSLSMKCFSPFRQHWDLLRVFSSPSSKTGKQWIKSIKYVVFQYKLNLRKKFQSLKSRQEMLSVQSRNFYLTSYCQLSNSFAWLVVIFGN